MAKQVADVADYDDVLARIARYVDAMQPPRGATLATAALCLADAVGCAIAALADPDCVARLGPWVSGTVVADGVPVWGTSHIVDPIKAAHDISVMIRWLDLSDTTFVGGHPSDNLGAILAVADFVGRKRRREGGPPLVMADVYAAMVAAYEIQGLLAADNRFDDPAVGLDQAIYVKLASCAVATRLFGGNAATIAAALSNAVLDGPALSAYRHAPNSGPRKGWAGGDASSRGVVLALDAIRGEPGYRRALSAPVWGFEAVHLGGAPVKLNRPLGHFVLGRISAMCFHQRMAQAVRIGRNQHQMDMVRHQAVGEHGDARRLATLGNHGAVSGVVVIAEERLQPPVATLGDVGGMPGTTTRGRRDMRSSISGRRVDARTI